MDRGAVDGSATDKPWKTTEASKGDHGYSGRPLAKTEDAWGLEKEQNVTGSRRPRQARICPEGDKRHHKVAAQTLELAGEGF